MNFSSLTLIATVVLSLTCPSGSLQSSARKPSHAKPQKPNVVFFIVDDFNVEHDAPAATTSGFERIAKDGVKFTHAYANHAICAPSRSSLFTGILGQTSRNLFWDEWYMNSVLSGSETLMEHFKMNGYKTFGTGKLLHHDNSTVPGSQWDEYGYRWTYGPLVKSTTLDKFRAHPALPINIFNLTRIYHGETVPYVEKTGVNYAIIDNPLPEGYVWSYADSSMKYEGINDMIDELSAEWAVDKIKHLTKDDSGPFFLAVGIVRPHAPLYCPRKYFDMVPSAQDTLLDFDPAAVCEGAKLAEDDMCGSQKLWTAEDKSIHTGSKYFSALKRAYANDPARGLKEHKQAYHACKAFAMAQMEKVLDAIDESPFIDNTIVIAISDNGLSNGLHEFVYKNNVWEDATHVPLYIRAPGIAKAGTIVDQPVTLVDIYPTLKDLCGLSTDTVKTASGASLDGHSLRTLLEGSASTFWDGPRAAASMAYAEFQSRSLPEECHTDPTCHHWAVRTKEKRYILYNNGQEELYDLVNDPHEMIDLSQKSLAAVNEMRHELVRTTGLDASKLGKQK